MSKLRLLTHFFLPPEEGLYLPPNKNGDPDAGGAVEVFNRSFVIKHYKDPDTGTNNVKKIDDMSEIDENDPNQLSYGSIHISVSRLPYGFAAKKDKGIDEHSPKRLAIRTNERSISFVRAGREIETLKILPHTERDFAAGLGSWLTLQSYDYHWACEIKFNPTLDEVFGISNDKQKVRPLEDFWRVLASEDIRLDKALSKEHGWQVKIRKQKAAEREKAIIQEKTELSAEPTFAEKAAATSS